MFDGASGVMERANSGGNGGREELPWRVVDRRLRSVAKQRAVLDAEELRLLVIAERVAVHRELGMATMLEYVERILGYGPKTGKERLRVARALVGLPATAAALEEGVLPFSAVRELCRFVTSETEDEWLHEARGKCLREIEQMSSGRKRGDRPGDRPNPDLALRPITIELTPPTLALFRDAVRRLEDEMGHPLTDDEAMAAMCATVLDGPAPRGAAAAPGDEVAETEQPRTAPYQVALTVCVTCDDAWHDAGGRAIAVPASTVAQARCDSQNIGRTDGGTPERSWQEVPPAVARMVLRRDRGHCGVPGCRSARWLQIHHIVERANGGSNDPANLLCLCFAHHQLLHQGKLTISGTAPDALVISYAEAAPPPDNPASAALAYQVLEQLAKTRAR